MMIDRYNKGSNIRDTQKEGGEGRQLRNGLHIAVLTATLKYTRASQNPFLPTRLPCWHAGVPMKPCARLVHDRREQGLHAAVCMQGVHVYPPSA
jgi:hypothetical protein